MFTILFCLSARCLARFELVLEYYGWREGVIQAWSRFVGGRSKKGSRWDSKVNECGSER